MNTANALKFICIVGCCLWMVALVHAGEAWSATHPAPVSIKVVAMVYTKEETLQVQFKNTSTLPVVIDLQGLHAPDLALSKDVPSLVGGMKSHFETTRTSVSTKARPSLSELQQQEPKRVVTVAPGQTFTTEISLSTQLSGIGKQFTHGVVEVRFSFHDFLLAVDGKETDADTFKAGVKAGSLQIDRN